MKFVCQGRRSGDYKNRVEEMKSTRGQCTLYYGEKPAMKQRRAKLSVQLACKGHGFIDRALKKGYNQARERAE